jgi:hypothetical protein
MESLFIKYDQALELKELGFDEPCFAFFWNTGKFYTCGDYPHTISYHTQNQLGDYNLDSTSAPLYQQAFKFFREKHNLLGNVYSNASGWLWEIHDNIGGTHRFGSEYSGDCEESGMFTLFEKAEQECLKKLIEIVKTKK